MISYYGLVFDLQNLGRDIFLLQVLFGAVDFLGRAASNVLLRFFGRRVVLASAQALGGLSILANVLVPPGEARATGEDGPLTAWVPLPCPRPHLPRWPPPLPAPRLPGPSPQLCPSVTVAAFAMSSQDPVPKQPARVPTDVAGQSGEVRLARAGARAGPASGRRRELQGKKGPEAGRAWGRWRRQDRCQVRGSLSGAGAASWGCRARSDSLQEAQCLEASPVPSLAQEAPGRQGGRSLDLGSRDPCCSRGSL